VAVLYSFDSSNRLSWSTFALCTSFAISAFMFKRMWDPASGARTVLSVPRTLARWSASRKRSASRARISTKKLEGCGVWWQREGALA
jgi:hypothetical protein